MDLFNDDFFETNKQKENKKVIPGQRGDTIDRVNLMTDFGDTVSTSAENNPFGSFTNPFLQKSDKEENDSAKQNNKKSNPEKFSSFFGEGVEEKEIFLGEGVGGKESTNKRSKVTDSGDITSNNNTTTNNSMDVPKSSQKREEKRIINAKKDKKIEKKVSSVTNEKITEKEDSIEIDKKQNSPHVDLKEDRKIETTVSSPTGKKAVDGSVDGKSLVNKEESKLNGKKGATTSQLNISMRTRTGNLDKFVDLLLKNREQILSPGAQLKKEKFEKDFERKEHNKGYKSSDHNQINFTVVEDMCDSTIDVIEGICEKTSNMTKKSVVGLFSSFQNKMLRKRFKRNDNIIQYEDFMFYEMNQELMLFKYVGINTEIVIPSYVEGLPVCYLDKDFLKFNSLKSITRGLSVDQIQNTSLDRIKDSFMNIKSIQLPDTLKIIPAKVFNGCRRIEELIIPESVEIIQPGAFLGCKPERIIFLGPAPDQLKDCNLSKVSVYCKKEYFETYFELLRNYDDYIASERIKFDYLKLRDKILSDKNTPFLDRLYRASDVRNITSVETEAERVVRVQREREQDRNSLEQKIKLLEDDLNLIKYDYSILTDNDKEYAKQCKKLESQIVYKKSVLKGKLSQFEMVKRHHDSVSNLKFIDNDKKNEASMDLNNIKDSCNKLKKDIEVLQSEYKQLKQQMDDNIYDILDRKDRIMEISRELLILKSKLKVVIK